MKSVLKLLFIISVLVFTSCSSFVRFTSDDSVNTENSANNQNEVNPGNMDITEEDYTGDIITGIASYYADKFHGNKTANGEIFDQEDYTAAHKTLPFGTKVLVTNLENNKSVVVRVNDRGPFVRGRVIDLSRTAAEEIDMIKSGVVEVEIRIFK
ncbi:septal ring lytic transglycosylase RlpA family protein [Bacteroidota bacterium]